MVTDHLDNKLGNLLPSLHGLLFLISSKSFFQSDRIALTTAFVTPVVEHWLENYQNYNKFIIPVLMAQGLSHHPMDW